MNWQDLIEINPAVQAGKPILRGTRLSVELILDLLAGGATESEIIENYPGLTHEHILACVAYAAELVRTERIFPLGA